MTSTTEQLLASPGWVPSTPRAGARLRLAPTTVRFAVGASRAADAAAAVGVLGATAALWASVLLAIW